MSWTAKVFLVSCCVVSALGLPIKENDWRTQFRQLTSEVDTKCPNYYFHHARYDKNISCSEVCPYKKTQDTKIKYCFDNCRDYLRCVATILPNGSRVVTELFRDEIPSNHTTACRYPLFYHPKFGFSHCADVCARNENFCSHNCPGFFKTCRDLPQQMLMSSTGHMSSFSVTPSASTPTSSILHEAQNTISRRVTTGTDADSWLWIISLSASLLATIFLIIVVVAVLLLTRRRWRNNRRKSGYNEGNQPQVHGDEEEMVNLAAGGRNTTQKEEEQAQRDKENAPLNPETVASVLQVGSSACSSSSMCCLNDKPNSASQSSPIYRQPVQESSSSENKHADGDATSVKCVSNDDEEPAVNDNIVSLRENDAD